MTEQPSPWARPPAGSDDPARARAYPPAGPGARPTATAVPPGAGDAAGPDAGPGRVGHPTGDRPGYRAGTVTRLAPAPPPIPAAAPPRGPDDPVRRNRLMMRWFGFSAVGVVVVGLVVILAMALTGGGNPFAGHASGPTDTRPDLAKLCPPPSADAATGAPAPPPPAGPRTVDTSSGISYAAFGQPWQPWRDAWTKGTLHVAYETGQYFITEEYVDRDGVPNQYLASILSGSVPAANNDALTLDLQCTGRQVAADVRAEYYPRPNTMDLITDEQTTLGGRPAWLTEFRMHFHEKGLRATDELVGLALVDVGRPRAAVLYVSIPGTHKSYDYVVDSVLRSVRPTG